MAGEVGSQAKSYTQPPSKTKSMEWEFNSECIEGKSDPEKFSFFSSPEDCTSLSKVSQESYKSKKIEDLEQQIMHLKAALEIEKSKESMLQPAQGEIGVYLSHSDQHYRLHS